MTDERRRFSIPTVFQESSPSTDVIPCGSPERSCLGKYKFKNDNITTVMIYYTVKRVLEGAYHAERVRDGWLPVFCNGSPGLLGDEVNEGVVQTTPLQLRRRPRQRWRRPQRVAPGDPNTGWPMFFFQTPTRKTSTENSPKFEDNLENPSFRSPGGPTRLPPPQEREPSFLSGSLAGSEAFFLDTPPPPLAGWISKEWNPLNLQSPV